MTPPRQDAAREAAWRTSILQAEGLADWTIKANAADPYCWLEQKIIQLPPDATPALFLHEVAHALHPTPEPNHYHGGGWADAYGRLVTKYMTVAAAVPADLAGLVDRLCDYELVIGRIVDGKIDTVPADQTLPREAAAALLALAPLQDSPIDPIARELAEIGKFYQTNYSEGGEAHRHGCTISFAAMRLEALREENEALRERLDRAEKALRTIADTRQSDTDNLTDRDQVLLFRKLALAALSAREGET